MRLISSFFKEQETENALPSFWKKWFGKTKDGSASPGGVIVFLGVFTLIAVLTQMCGKGGK